MIDAIHHVGIAVRDLSAALARYRLLGFSPEAPEDVPSAGARVCFLALPGATIEFVVPLGPESPVARFLEKRGEGLHHVAFSSKDVAAELSRLEGAGFELVDRAPRLGARGAQVAFIHPRSTHGVLLELVQEP
ncbi:MAG TPA: methylmalonyl-CoA epimerase [Thermoplasmata archaeon]|jgi:methylmalonyl-CoA/ethylmalonyl-CoA epimerase